MEYKTTIELVTEAGDKNEAIEIAGEYLSGNIVSGVRMKCRAKPVSYYKIRSAVSVAVVALVIAVNVIFTLHTKTSLPIMTSVAGIDAIQPPLKTSTREHVASFKKEWSDKETRKALDYLKK